MARIRLRNRLGPVEANDWDRLYREFDRRVRAALGGKSFLLSDTLVANADFWSLIGKKVGIRGNQHAPTSLAVDGSECTATPRWAHLNNWPIYDHAPFTNTANALTVVELLNDIDIMTVSQETQYNTLLGSLEAHGQVFGGKRWFYQYRPTSTTTVFDSPPQRIDTLSVVDAIFDGMDAFQWPLDWDKYNCFRCHNLQPRPLELTFATGTATSAVGVTIPPWESRAIRRASVSSRYSFLRNQVFFPFRKRDVRYLTGIGDPTQGFMLANNVCRPSMIVEWLKVLGAVLDPTEPGLPIQEDLAQFGIDPSNPDNTVGNLFYHTGKFWSIKWESEAVTDKRELAFTGLQNLNALMGTVGGTAALSGQNFVVTGDSSAGITHDFCGHQTNIVPQVLGSLVSGSFTIPPLLWDAGAQITFPRTDAGANMLGTVAVTASNQDFIDAITAAATGAGVTVANVALRYSPLGPIATMDTTRSLNQSAASLSVYDTLNLDRTATVTAGATIDPQAADARPAWPQTLGQTVDRYHRTLAWEPRRYMSRLRDSDLIGIAGRPKGEMFDVANPQDTPSEIYRAEALTWTGTAQVSGYRISIPESDNLRTVAPAIKNDTLTWAARGDAIASTGVYSIDPNTGYRIPMADWNMLAWMNNAWKRSAPLITVLDIPFILNAPLAVVSSNWALIRGNNTLKTSFGDLATPISTVGPVAKDLFYFVSGPLDAAQYPWLELETFRDGRSFWITIPAVQTGEYTIDTQGPTWAWGFAQAVLTEANDDSETLEIRSPIQDACEQLGIDTTAHTERFFSRNYWRDGTLTWIVSPVDGDPYYPPFQPAQTLSTRYLSMETLQAWGASQEAVTTSLRRTGTTFKHSWRAQDSVARVCGAAPAFTACNSADRFYFDSLLQVENVPAQGSTVDPNIDGSVAARPGVDLDSSDASTLFNGTNFRHNTVTSANVVSNAMAVDDSSALRMNAGTASLALNDGARYTHQIDYISLT